MNRLPSLAAALILTMSTASQGHAQDAGSVLPLDSVRNFQTVSDRLASSGQIGYDQIPLIRDAGYEVVINLAIADEERNGREGFLVAESGLTYVHIPVVWTDPTENDVALFFDVMKANEGRKVYVHCFANMRASAFVYLYRTLIEGVPEPEARATMFEVWDPAEQKPWSDLIERVMANHDRGVSGGS